MELQEAEVGSGNSKCRGPEAGQRPVSWVEQDQLRQRFVDQDKETIMTAVTVISNVRDKGTITGHLNTILTV